MRHDCGLRSGAEMKSDTGDVISLVDVLANDQCLSLLCARSGGSRCADSEGESRPSYVDD